jgi:steroid delta-isomerase-like uncharacterized protein
MTDPKELCRRFYEDVVNGEDYDLIDELVAPDVVDHEEFPGIPEGREGVREFFKLMRAAFPDMRVSVEQVFGEGELAAVRTRTTGTHRGEFMGVPATDQSVDFEGIDIVRVVDGRAVEHWGLTDTMTMMQQLGVIEGAPAAAA